MTFNFSGDTGRDFLVGIQHITSTSAANGPTTALSGNNSVIFAYIDSLVPHIWLPTDVCQAFETSFGLVWNATSNLHLVNDTLHSQLLARNASVVFTLGTSLSGNSSVDIVLPYSSFDLTASAPLVQNSSRYFPLRRVNNETQYTLGRAFLQNAYIIADYDRSNFSVSQAVFPGVGAPGNIVAILPPAGPGSVDHGLKSGGIVGIVVAILVIIISVAIVTFMVYRRRQKQRKVSRLAAQLEEERFQKAELDGTDASQEYGRKAHTELDAQENTRHELEVPNKAAEVHGHGNKPAHEQLVHELAAEDVLLPELESPALIKGAK
ncbi:hypothetical protein BJ546DRAFT_985951 [Cryomyces antarcticus]